MRDSLHHATVAQEYIGVMVDDLMSRAVEGSGEGALRHGHAHRVANALAERTGGRLDAKMHFALRMARRLSAPLPEILQLLHRQRIPGQVKHRVQQHRGVAVGKHESITIHPGRIGGIELKHVPPQHFGNVRHAHWRAYVTRFGFFDRIHR